jgi:molybdopterin-guanine dinucleotide biosynthesis protein B
MFDKVIIADWSASSSPSPRKPSANAIWIGVAGDGSTDPSYHRTRADAEATLRTMLGGAKAVGQRVLLGVDFPLGYPSGFAKQLTGQCGARAVWDWMATNVADGPDNANARFHLADRINRTFGHAGPYWGRPRGLKLEHLGECKRVDYGAFDLSERRRVEQDVPRAQPLWKLYTTGSVGSQAIMGMPMIHRLAQLPGAAVWPFEDISQADLVIAEVYPSLIDAAVRADPRGMIKDAVQVDLLASGLWRLGQTGALAHMLADVPDWAGRKDEGWILGAGMSQTLLGALR